VATLSIRAFTGRGGYLTAASSMSLNGPRMTRETGLAVIGITMGPRAYLTDSSVQSCLRPRFSPVWDRICTPAMKVVPADLCVTSVVQRRVLESAEGTMSFAPRFSPSEYRRLFLTQVGTRIFLHGISARPIDP